MTELINELAIARHNTLAKAYAEAQALLEYYQDMQATFPDDPSVGNAVRAAETYARLRKRDLEVAL